MPEELESDVSEETPEPAAKDTTTIPVAGIGGSAGGLEVFKQLLADMPADTGLAIVFVQHLDPKHHSLLSEILARSTTMAVREAADGMPVEANHVYVIPANGDLTIAQGMLRLTTRTQGPGAHMPIDRFLRSLAEECGSRAIGVTLSAAGTDGSAGIQAIKAAGGVTFAQDQYTAKFASMPQAAVATNCVDFVLPPERIAAELVRMGRHPYVADSALIWSPSHFTWMDTNHPAGTPREGYPVEIQVLWIRLLRLLEKIAGVHASACSADTLKRELQQKKWRG